ncbi:hypothetical protein HOL59_02680 [Candidatus Woesearchaeota archaeon]|jgi:poly(3-hydroxybutyrate) depolymerase|nr:hypothetical protein [Candidatus Woesearchaeota archaeon]
MNNKKMILGMLIGLIAILLMTNVLAAEQKFDKKAYKNAVKYANKKINSNKLVKRGIIDKNLVKKVVRTTIYQQYKNGEKLNRKELRKLIRKELVNVLKNWRNTKTAKNPVPVVNDILGCTDSDANNFNSNANVNDDSCTYDVLGCTDSDANNFNSNANVNSGCTYDVLGCTDADANNFNADANVNDGCTYDVLGCMDADANNFNADANVNDGCTYDVLGCMDEDANNFNPQANQDDGSCEVFEAESTLTEHNINVNFNNQVKDRKYLVYEPAVCKDKECSLLFMFHGLGGNYQQAAGDYYNWQTTADENGFIVAFPDSLTLEAKKYGAASDPAGKHWDITPLSFSATQDTKFVEEMINEIDSIYSVDKSNVFSTGHSYGGYFSYYLNFALPNQFKAFATHSAGLMPFNVYGFTVYWPAAPKSSGSAGNTPAMIIYSDGDNVAPKLYSDTLESQMSAKGHASVKQKSTITGHAWDKSMNQEQWDFFMAS